MTTPVVWSERPEPNSDGLRDCTYAAGLTALVAGGRQKFEHGIYTVAEREALERSDHQPDETGASLTDLIHAVQTRYGITWRKSSVELLAQHHTRTDLAFVIQGRNGNLRAGHNLRRWDPTFTGDHAVCIIPNSDGVRVTWFDPLAPMRYPGDTVTWATVMAWIGKAAEMITVREDAYAPPPPKPAKPRAYTLRIAAHAKVRRAIVTSTGKISGWKDPDPYRWGGNPSSAPCKKPVVKLGTVNGKATVALVTAGLFVGEWVQISGRVTVTSKEI